MRSPGACVVAFALLGLVSLAADDAGNRLRKAAEGGKLDQVEQLLKQGAPVDPADKRGRTAVVLAAGKGHVAVVQALCLARAPCRRGRPGRRRHTGSARRS